MPPKTPRALGSGRPGAKKGIVGETYEALTSADNRSVVTAVAFFAAGVAFLHSSWSELLLPPI